MNLIISSVEKQYRRLSKYEISLDSGVPTGFSTGIYTHYKREPSKLCLAWLSPLYINSLVHRSHFELAGNSRLSRKHSVETKWRQLSSLKLRKSESDRLGQSAKTAPEDHILTHISTRNIENLKGTGGSMATLNVTIVGWEKYNPRKDFKRPTWFALSNSILENPVTFNLTAEELKAWIYVLCQASKANSATVQIDTEHATKVCQVKSSALTSALNKLTEKQSVQITNAAVQNPISTNKQTDNTNKQTDTCSGLVDQIVALWNEQCGSLPKIKTLTDKRKATLRVQIGEYGDVVHWRDALLKLTQSKFVMGKWCPNFDDFLREDIRIKALEGKYDNREGGKSPDPIGPKIRESIKKFGHTNGGEAKSYLGDDGWEVVKKMGGWARLCGMQEKQFQELMKGQ